MFIYFLFLFYLFIYSIFNTTRTILILEYWLSVKIAWHEPNDMSTSSATSVIAIRRLSEISSLLQCFHWQYDDRGSL